MGTVCMKATKFWTDDNINEQINNTIIASDYTMLSLQRSIRSTSYQALLQHY